MIPPTKRFSTRVEYYLKYRPHYPMVLMDILQKEIGLTPSWVIADVGSGTGFSTEPFLRNGNTVYGIEPNAEMRRAGEMFLQSYSNFHSINATAEATTLPDASVDLVFAGSAFHWFDVAGSKREFHRILKPNGQIAVGWVGGIGKKFKFMRKFRVEEEPKEYSHDLTKFDVLFGKGGCRELKFTHEQSFDWDSIHGRILSMSYAPLPGHPLYEPMVAELRKVFDELQHDGKITVTYDAKVFVRK